MSPAAAELPRSVLLTYNDTSQNAPELTRVLKRFGCSVHHLQLTGHQPVLQEATYRQQAAARVIETIRRLRIEVYIPLFEEVFFLAAHREQLGCRTLLCEPEVYLELHKKRRAALFCRKHGLPSVPTLLLEADTTQGAVERFLGPRRPVFLKEDDSRGGYGSGSFWSVEALFRKLDGAPPDQYVVQPSVDGDLWVIQGVFVDGVLWDYEILRKLNIWDGRGTVRMLVFHRVEENEAALELLQRVGERTRYQGMLEFECLGQGDDLKILEFNPRFSGDFLHSPQTGSSLCVNTLRAYAGLEPLPHRSVQGRITRNSWTLGRAFSRPGWRLRPVLDPRWPLRWFLAEARAGWTRLRHPYRACSPLPDSFTSFRELPTPASARSRRTSSAAR
ncbi:MAG: hypothetical protein HY319_05135 [Armatimonadetes bacterium]|nr:hypothetical protein [Armatimonadota bacterium]